MRACQREGGARRDIIVDVRRLRVVLGLVGLCGALLFASRDAAAGSSSLPHQSLKSFLALAERGLSGSFSEVYDLSHSPGGGTVSVAQSAQPGQRPFVIGRGTWSFVYQNEAGYASQWIERGQTAWDCWHPPGVSQWTCSGPGQFRYVNGYLMAISPFVPGQIQGDINAVEGALTSKMPQIKKLVEKRTFFASHSAHFGPLQCMRVAGASVCLDRSGVVVSGSGGYFGYSVTLVSYSSIAPKSAFTLNGSIPPSEQTFVALHQPYVS